MLSRALTIVLILAAASPPPRVSNALIAGASSEASKPVQSRARNRIASPAPPESGDRIAPLASGPERPTRSDRPSSLLSRPSTTPVAPAPISRANRATFRLRC